MNAIDLLESALSGIVFGSENVPVNRMTYKGSKKTHITYYILLENTEISADDEEQERSIHFTIDIWSNNSKYDSLKTEVRSRLKSAGFVITSVGPEIYEDNTQIYHIPIDCWIENLKEE